MFSNAKNIDSTSELKSNPKKSLLQSIKDFIKENYSYSYILIGVIIPIVLGQFVFVLGIVPTESMVPTLEPGDMVICNRLAVREGNIARGDIVSFYHNDTSLVKRVIGLPNDEITITGGNVYVNGVILDESEYLDSDIVTNTHTETFVVPDGCYFMLGDNRTSSYDSRYWPDPYVPLEEITGVYLFSCHIPFLG